MASEKTTVRISKSGNVELPVFYVRQSNYDAQCREHREKKGISHNVLLSSLELDFQNYRKVEAWTLHMVKESGQFSCNITIEGLEQLIAEMKAEEKRIADGKYDETSENYFEKNEVSN